MYLFMNDIFTWMFAVVVIWWCFMTGVNVWLVYLAPQNIPSAIALTLGNRVVLYCTVKASHCYYSHSRNPKVTINLSFWLAHTVSGILASKAHNCNYVSLFFVLFLFLILYFSLLLFITVTLSILQSQFIDKRFKKTENYEQNVVLLLFLFTLDFIFPRGKFGSPYLIRHSSCREQRYPFLPVCAVSSSVQTMVWLPVCAVSSCVQTMVWLPVFGIFNVRTDVDTCDWTRGLYGHRQKVGTGMLTLGEKSLAAPGLEPASLS